MKWISLAAILLALQVQPAISLSPDSGQPGSVFVVSGTGFTPGERVKVSWDGSNLGGTVRVKDDGTFEYSGLAPEGAALGPHTVTAQGVGGNTERASATFTVEAPPTSTTASTAATTSTTATTQASKAAPVTTAASAPDTTVPVDSEAVTTTAVVTDDSVIEPAAGESRGNDTSESISTDVPAPVTTTPSGGTGGLVVGLIAVGLMAGVTLFMWRRSRDPEEDTLPPSGTSDQMGAAQNLPLVTAADLQGTEGDWSRNMMGLTPVGEVRAAVTSATGLLALGQTEQDDEGWGQVVVWGSKDGSDWNEMALLGRGSASFAVPWRDGWVLASSHESHNRIDTKVWWSSDGHQWDQLTESGDPSLAGVSFEGGIGSDDLIASWGRGPHGPGVWVSRDGSAWTQSPLRGSIDLIAATGEGMLAFGREPDRRRPVVAYSTDAASWAPLDRDSLFMFDGISVATHVSLDAGMLVAGTDLMRGMAVILVSDDGRRWMRAPFEPEPGTSIEHLAAVGRRYVAVGVDNGTRRRGRSDLAVWESEDAVTWERAPVEGLFADAAADSMIAVGDSIHVFGKVFVAGDGAKLDSIPVMWSWNNSDISPIAEPAMASASDSHL
ncbi:MAG: hypothetical protein R3258_09545 [Acidimicrobiia bacterium]|nr:hypothetical protein [Acidimicrobiia bacterium]